VDPITNALHSLRNFVGKVHCIKHGTTEHVGIAAAYVHRNHFISGPVVLSNLTVTSMRDK